MKNLLFASFFLITLGLSAQDIPLNPAVLHGKLANGLTYYIQKNQLPKDRAMFYLVVNAGAIDENDNQNGLAHFCEHMAFNGTKNLPDKALLNYMEKNGVSFGKGVNAFTSSAITCYNLNDVPTTREILIDSTLLILNEWATNVLYKTEEINKERGVIHEEWRTRGGASRRLGDVTNKVLMNGTKYASHNIIGTLDVIDNADPDLLRKFYQDFYRPDLQAVIVVGDIDPDAIRTKIEKMFGPIAKRETPLQKQKEIVPGNKELEITMATDKEAQNITITQYIKHAGPGKKDVGYLKERMTSSLYNIMLSDRYNELLQKENPPMISAYSGYGSMTKFQDAYYVSINTLNNDPIRSLKAAMTENERVKQHGFTETELERAKKRMLVSYENSFKEKDKQMSANYVNRYMSHFTDGYPSPSAEYSLELAKTYLPQVTLAQVNDLAKKWMTDENRVIVVHGPEKEGVKMPTDAEIRTALTEVQQSKIEPYQDKVVDNKLITEELNGSPVIKEEKIKDFDGTKFTLKNGVTIYFKPTDNKADEVQLQAFSNGGLSLYSPEELPSARYAATVRNLCGVGKYSAQDLRKVLTGKVVGINPVMTDLEEMIICNSSVADFETLLQLIYLQFTQPRHDDAVLKSNIDRNKASLQNRKSDPNSAFSDTLQMLMSNYSKRVSLITPEYFDKIDFKKAYAVADERYRDAGDFKFVLIGNVDPVKMKPLIEKYLGSIPDIDRKEFWVDHKVGPKKGRTQKEIQVPMKDPKAQVYVHYFGELPNTPENEEYLKAIQYILRMRYTETIREKEGGTYGVGVSATMASRPVNNYKITMNFTCDPKKADFLKGLLYDEVKKLKESGVTEQEVAKTRENFMKEASEKLKDNYYILDRVKNYINNGVYTPLPQYTTEIYQKLDGQKIQKLAQKVFAEDQVELVMKPTEPTAGK